MIHMNCLMSRKFYGFCGLFFLVYGGILILIFKIEEEKEFLNAFNNFPVKAILLGNAFLALFILNFKLKNSYLTHLVLLMNRSRTILSLIIYKNLVFFGFNLLIFLITIISLISSLRVVDLKLFVNNFMSLLLFLIFMLNLGFMLKITSSSKIYYLIILFVFVQTWIMTDEEVVKYLAFFPFLFLRNNEILFSFKETYSLILILLLEGNAIFQFMNKRL